MLDTFLALTLAFSLAHAPDPRARAILDTAATRMGGIESLRAVTRIRRDVMTEWQQTTFDDRPNTPALSYEWSTELRDYSKPAWRYSRRYLAPTGWREIVDVVTDSVAALGMNGRWRPQNIAYVEERDQVFTFAPERIVVLAADAPDTRALPDTTIRGVRYARVAATVGRYRSTLFFSRRDGLLALAHYRVNEINDFGLAPWGEMDVDVWYSRWTKLPEAGIAIPVQLDVYRVGRPYKRMVTVAAKANIEIPADSFAISDSLRTAYLTTARRPMHDLPLDSARIVDGSFATFATPGTPAGAVKIGGKWVLLEAGTAPVSIERSVAWVKRADPNAEIAGAIVTAPTGAGGVSWLAEQKMATWIASVARPYADAALRGAHQKPGARMETISSDRWIRVGSDSLRVVTIAVPDYESAVVVYAPTLRWAYVWHPGPVQMDYVAAQIRRKGWSVERIGTRAMFIGAKPSP